MSTKTNRAALAPAQATAQLAALDFASVSEALARAHAAAKLVKGEAATDIAADQIAECADRLLSIPTTNPAQIAEKVSAYAWLHNHASQPFSDRDTRLRIADTGSDAAKGLLAIYLDLTAPPLPSFGAGTYGGRSDVRAQWDAALAAYEAARGERDALLAEGVDDEEGNPYDAASAKAGELLDALLSTPAPDGVAMGVKAALVIEQYHADYIGDAPENPATIARLLAGDWSETTLAALYIDGLRLSGSTSPIVNVRPDAFDPEAWLAEVEAATGARLSKIDRWGNVGFVAARDSAKVADAEAQLATIYQYHADRVATFAQNRDRDADVPPPPLEPLTPEREAAAREALMDALAGLAPEGSDQQAIRAKLAEVFA